MSPDHVARRRRPAGPRSPETGSDPDDSPPPRRAATGDPASGPDIAARPDGAFRPDIEGLRAVAVLAVLGFHAGVPLMPGGYVGVDIFFVISGFLITGLLLRDLDRTGSIDVLRFYAQRARRLLPALLVVLLAVAVAALVLFPPVRTATVARDLLAAATYVINWKFAIGATDYFAESGPVSPLQHIWSLAVEEQFYLLWPAVLLLAASWQRRTRRPNGRLVMMIMVATVTAASLAYSIHLTAVNAGFAYFSTFARAWELGIGGLLAIGLLHWRPGRRPAGVLAVSGAAAIVGSTVLITEDTPFPGIAALLPTLGAAAVIAAGSTGRPPAPQRLLTLAPLRHIGRVSYSWYLWHWPALVVADAVWGAGSGSEGLGTVPRLVVVALCYLPAAASTQLLEDRIRHSSRLARSPGRGLRLGVACTAAAVVAGVALQLSVPTIDEAPEEQAAGGKVLQRDRSLQRAVNSIRPTPERADADRSRMWDDGCLAAREETVSGDCVYGDPQGATTVALFGDSHAMQWFPALNKVAEENGWKIIGLTKSGCQPADVTVFNAKLGRAYTECDQWRDYALDRIARTKPDLVVVSSRTRYTVLDGDRKLDPDRSAEELRKGYTRVLERLQDDTDDVVAIDDIPVARQDVVDCVATSMHDLEQCAEDKETAAGDTPFGRAARDTGNRARFIDPRPVLCPGDKCPAVIGDVLVYRDDLHLTATYAATLDQWLAEELPLPSSG